MSRELNRYWITDAGRAALGQSPADCICITAGPDLDGPDRECPQHGEYPLWFLTFGMGYARHPHPRGSWVHPDGWVTIVAPTYIEARRIAVDLFGICWSDLYDAALFEASLYPRGELLRVMVPAGLIETEDHR